MTNASFAADFTLLSVLVIRPVELVLMLPCSVNNIDGLKRVIR